MSAVGPDLGDGLHERVAQLEQRIAAALAVCESVPTVQGSARSELAADVRHALRGARRQ